MTDNGKRAGSKTMQLLDALRGVALQDSNSDIVSEGRVKSLTISEGSVRFNVVLPGPDEAVEDYIEQQVGAQLQQLDWISDVEMGFIAGEVSGTEGARPSAAAVSPPPAAGPLAAAENPLSRAPAGAPQAPPASGDEPLMPGVKHVIAVGSGKGGVGKSTISVNLALALAGLGHRVGLLDGDVYGPSVPLMLGLSEQPQINDREKLVPPEIHGLRVISMGLLLRPDQAVVWRGPMIHGVMKQFLGDVDWGELDFLIIDLPPGTGDAPLSLTQSVPLTAAVVVTTPQEVASQVAGKAIAMFQRLGIRLLGVVENMSSFVCPHCGESSEIFDRGGGRRLAAQYELPFLGEIPLDIRMRHGGDVGQPVMLQFGDSELAERFRTVARELAVQAETRPAVAPAAQ